ncbi:protein kinase [Streptomyces sp. NPDC058646]|uniref:protein kinase domain-containing protein n=1 Tax=Streptomyces sp. NPDC058646 TaxID=3346574 RepID=UPI0036605FE0
MQPLEAGDPERIGTYELVGRLGSGGMGEVFLGRSADQGLAAVKAAHAEYAHDAEFRRRFAREVEAARRVDGRFTAAVLDADPSAPRPWMATEYIPGVSVTEAVVSVGPLPEASLRALAAGIVAALEAIHSAGLTHRDLKPSNVLLADDGPRVIDFGIARAGDHTQITTTGMTPGTPGYMAPEQLRGGDVGPAADVYALGATLVYAATGHGPYGQGDALAMMYRTIESAPQLDDVPAALRPTVARCLAKDPADRPTVPRLRAQFAVGSTLGHGGWLPARHSTMVLGRRESAHAAATVVRPSSRTGPADVSALGVSPRRGPSRRSMLLTGAGGALAVSGGAVALLFSLDGQPGGKTGAAAGSPSPSGATDVNGTRSPGGSTSPAGASSPDGTASAGGPAGGGALPVITSGQGFGEKPTLAVGSGPAPTELVVRTLVRGSGATIGKGDSVTCHFLLQPWDRAEVLDSSFARGEPFTAQIGVGHLIEGWDTALLGQRAGSRLQFAVPPAQGYGSQGQDKIKGTDTLVFVVDILVVSRS